MAVQRRHNTKVNYHTKANDYYIEGNTVRKAAPQRVYDPKPQKKVRVDAQTRRNRERESVMSRGYVAFLIAAVLTVSVVLGLYIYLQSDVLIRMKNVAALESELLDLQTDNKTLEKRIDTSVPLNEIKNKAVNELGMRYPNADQIIYYSVDSEDYMEQYEDIPSK
ncbi:MAG: hypothetical protein HFG80_01890 [Eubacterium sp.]|jgi:hypothetical protein|nr:hypothetical protein [Eubacterium sp.]